jgi:hypothetical protein
MGMNIFKKKNSKVISCMRIKKIGAVAEAKSESAAPKD